MNEMKKFIRFGVFSNPSKDADGNESYHVRHETHGVANLKKIVYDLERRHHPEAPHFAAVVGELKNQIIDNLTDNYNVHIEGLGNFYLKLGFQKQTNLIGEEVKPHFTDPTKITGNDVVVESIGFIPDEEFLSELRNGDYHFENGTGKGNVGHSTQYNREQIIKGLDEYFENHVHITRQIMEGRFSLTKYMAQKWLDELSEMPSAYLRAEKIGTVFVYYKR